MTIDAGLSLSEAMRAVEHECPGWHLFTSDAGNIWAVTTANPDNKAGGFTLTAPTPEAMRREIAVQERIWGFQAKCWADAIPAVARPVLADRLADWRDRFYDAGADPARVRCRAHNGMDTLGLGHALMNCASEMRDLHTDVTAQAGALLAAPCPHPGCTHDRGSHLNGTGACGWCCCPSFGGEQIGFAVLDGAA